MNFSVSLMFWLLFPTQKNASFMLLSCAHAHTLRQCNTAFATSLWVFWKWDWIIVGTWVMTLIIVPLLLSSVGGGVTTTIVVYLCNCIHTAAARLTGCWCCFQVFAALLLTFIRFYVSSLRLCCWAGSFSFSSLPSLARQTTNSLIQGMKKTLFPFTHTRYDLWVENLSATAAVSRKLVVIACEKPWKNFKFSHFYFRFSFQSCKSDNVAVRRRTDASSLSQSILDLVEGFKAEFPWSARSRGRHTSRFRQVSIPRAVKGPRAWNPMKQ